MKGNGYAKKFTKRMNRGIALGLVLGIGLTCFVVADSLKFRRDTAAIGACIVSYITDLARLNERLEATDVGRVITQQDRDAMAAGLDEIFEKYHADPRLAESITVYEGFDSNEIADALEEWLRRTAGFELVSLDVDTGVDSPFTISYERQGHRFALARINDLPLTITLVGHLRSSIEIFLGGVLHILSTKYIPLRRRTCQQPNGNQRYTFRERYI